MPPGRQVPRSHWVSQSLVLLCGQRTPEGSMIDVREYKCGKEGFLSSFFFQGTKKNLVPLQLSMYRVKQMWCLYCHQGQLVRVQLPLTNTSPVVFWGEEVMVVVVGFFTFRFFSLVFWSPVVLRRSPSVVPCSFTKIFFACIETTVFFSLSILPFYFVYF